MAATSSSEPPKGTTKKYGKGERYIPHHSTKAKRFYPAEDEVRPKKVCVPNALALDVHRGGFDATSIL